MKNFKRLTAFFLALIMNLSLMSAAFAADGDCPGTDTDDPDIVWIFTDTDENPNQLGGLAPVTGFHDVKTTAWYYNDVMECAKLGIVLGFTDGTFKPEDRVTYVQFGSMLIRTFYSADVEKVADPSGKPWYYPNMQVMRDRNLDANTDITGQGGWPTIKCAGSVVSRYEMAMMLYNVLKDKGATGKVTSAELTAARKSLKDYYDKISPENQGQYTAAIQYNVALGIITGMTDGTFSGESSMTRAQACAVMVRMLNLINRDDVGGGQ